MTWVQIKFNTELGRLLRDEGMAQVSENAGEWKEVTGKLIDNWFTALPYGSVFTGEDVRVHLQECNVAAPHHPNAWSAVIGGRFRRWLKTDHIEITGWQQSGDPKAHARRLIAYQKIG